MDLARMTRAQLERALLLARELKRRHPWSAQQGPQALAFSSEADITGYGGAAGGGKTDLIVGLSTAKHKRVLIIRREKAQTEGIIQRLTEIVGNTVGFNSQKSIWRVPVGSGPLIEFGGLDNPGDERRWQGRPHDLKCVAAGTEVWMADGSRKAIEAVQVGDMVDTLEGPRRVERTMTSHRPAVEVIASCGGVELGRQTQGATHELLMADGVFASYPCPCGSASPKERLDARICAPPCSSTCSTSAQPLAALHEGLKPCAAPRPRREGRLGLWASRGGTEGIARGSALEAWSATLEGGAPPALCRRAWPTRLALALRSAVSSPSPHGLGRGVAGADAASSPLGFLGCYSFAPRRDGGQSRPGPGGDRSCARRQGDVGPRNPNGLLVDAQDKAPRRNPRRWSYAHPYSKGKRQTDRGARVASFAYADAGSLPLYDLTVAGANHYVTGAGFVNRNCFDETTEMREAQVRFIMGWTRTNDPSLKPRVVMTFNPPTTQEGRWIIKFFAPWLDPKHPCPAMPGELRYFTTIGENMDYELPDGRPFVLVDGEPVHDFDPELYTPEQTIKPKSRTFIPARLTDNQYYMATDYMSQLQALPEPLRSQMLNGDFLAGVEDDIWQVIPTAWVEIAQARWKARNVKPPMDSMGVDVARGGKDNTVLSRRHGWWFDELLVYPGTQTPNGHSVAGLVITHRRDEAPIHIDVIGVGSSPYDVLNTTGHQVLGVNVAEGSIAKDKSGRLGFVNQRSEGWWKMRELLDPAANNGIELPPDPRLLAELCTPRWRLQGSQIRVESREEIIADLRVSPDRASALILAAMETPKRAVMQAIGGAKQRKDYDPYA